MENEEVKDGNGYKIKCGREYMVFRSEYQGKVFYKIQVTKKNYDDTKAQAYKTVKFASKTLDTDIPDRTVIVIKNLFEDFYFKAGDKYNPIWTLVITDWDIIKTSQQTATEALETFNASDDLDLPF